MATAKNPAIGDTITFFYWTEGALHACPATVTAVHTPDVLSFDADIPEDVLAREGYVRPQTHSRRRTRAEDDVNASGSWLPSSSDPA